jgi:hypothetical protein
MYLGVLFLCLREGYYAILHAAPVNSVPLLLHSAPPSPQVPYGYAYAHTMLTSPATPGRAAPMNFSSSTRLASKTDSHHHLPLVSDVSIVVTNHSADVDQNVDALQSRQVGKRYFLVCPAGDKVVFQRVAVPAPGSPMLGPHRCKSQ